MVKWLTQCHHVTVSCPDGEPGCCVLHTDWLPLDWVAEAKAQLAERERLQRVLEELQPKRREAFP